MNDYQYQQSPPHPYGSQPQPGHPYAHPQQPPYPQQQSYPHPYSQQSHPHPQQPNPYPQQPYPYPQAPVVPEPVGDERRMLASAVDGTITVVAGLSLGLRLADDKSVGVFWAVVAACVFGVSFVHHVLGAVVFRTTVGKFLLFTRVVREADGGRPRFWQAVGRWLIGLTWLPMQPLRSLVWADGDPYEDGCGLRYVRSKDLR
ncbi:RDD family protein [Streptomyces hiroshimensis]|uniref:RDD domain-containing protein n=1 Tax=Streptomyces hiroshimensis TaxID=66424 RepID=A0ABQ2Y9R8_9ACTN|nr:RDD family protein [Streptomyces hiroshimensis]GGX76211.1 hypothetical protein GCM10010324_22300 [Streptomyces hiroshimensis]